MYAHDHHNNHDDGGNGYVYKYQYLLQQYLSNREGSIHNNKVGNTVRTQVNIHIELLVPIELPQLLSLPEHLL